MENLELTRVKVPELADISQSKALEIKNVFEPMVNMLEQFESAYNKVMKEAEIEKTVELTKQAKNLRLKIAKIRIEAKKVHDSEKKETLRISKAIDGVYNILKYAVVDKEEKLKEIENHFIILEKERLEKLQSERAEILSEYVEDAHERDLSSMEEDVWDAYLSTKKNAFLDKQKAEKKAERDRLKREKKQKIHNERKNSLINVWKFIDDKFQDFSDLTKKEFVELFETANKKQVDYDNEQKRLREENKRLRAESAVKTPSNIEKISEKEIKLFNNMVSDLNSIKDKYFLQKTDFKSEPSKELYSNFNTLIDKIKNYLEKYL